MRLGLVVLVVLVIAASPPAPVAASTGLTCGAAEGTHGAGDAALPDLVYAALKTGTRAVVAWSTPEETVASLTYSIDGGQQTTLIESSARRVHAFVLDELPRSGALCFAPSGGSTHALRLANAMYAHDGETYVTNLLVLANEDPQAALVRGAVDELAWRLRDATDGHVSVGRVIILFGDLDRHHSGWATCYLSAHALVTLRQEPERPLCSVAPDVVFTHESYPVGVAATYPDGIQKRHQSIWMTSHWHAGPIALSPTSGLVLTHEMGHYAFGAQDMYVGDGCNDFANDLSVMGNADVTELDDAIHRCPNEAQIPGYVPSWTRLRERFPLVPDRGATIDPGPTDEGAHYARHEFDLLPALPPQLQEIPQDDAASGADAPDDPAPGAAITMGGTYVGTKPNILDRADHYLVDAPGGTRVRLSLLGVAFCAAFVDANGRDVPGQQCVLGSGGDGATYVDATLPAEGATYIRVSAFAPFYAFSLAAPA